MKLLKHTILFSALIVIYHSNSYAHHIIGGEMYYSYISSSGNIDRYMITLRLFRDANAVGSDGPDGHIGVAELPDHVWISIFNNDTQALLDGKAHIEVAWTGEPTLLDVNDVSSCMTNVPNYQYQMAVYTQEVQLPKNNSGYTASYQTCCRVDDISNSFSTGRNSGSTFYTEIPPEPDNSPIFNSAIDIICAGKPFKLNYGASDSDAGDSLSYTFEAAFDSDKDSRDANDHNGVFPPYTALGYRNPFTAERPLGPETHIDPETGLITGTAPEVGKYVVTVAVSTWRNGRVIARHRKDFIINVADCDFASALLLQKETQCQDLTVQFSNDDQSHLNRNFHWEFYDADKNLIDISTDETPSITFPTAGDYHYKLIVNEDDIECSAEAEAEIKVYPGFTPAFSFDGECINSEVIFTDESQLSYGSIISWDWDFGNGSHSADVNPKYNYSSPNDYNVSLQIESDLGCKGTITKEVKMMEKPLLSVTSDSLICLGDDILLSASGSNPNEGMVTWTNNSDPGFSQTGFNIIVSPADTTTYNAYYVKSRGCENEAPVTVNVVKEVSLFMPGDTTICLTDTAFISPTTNGLHFNWTAEDNTILSETDAKDIFIQPAQSNTTYTLEASIGHCVTDRSISVTTVPYPSITMSNDTALCIGDVIRLEAQGGVSYQWSPVTYLNDNHTATPTATPGRTIQYTVMVIDNQGCPKPSFDSVLVEVDNPFVKMNVRDTAIVRGEPLQLNAETNFDNIRWTPSVGLDNPSIANPVAILNRDQNYQVIVTSPAGCKVTDAIAVKVFDLAPGFYIPNAFTPNSDNLNDRLRIIAPGIKELKNFRIFNRLGQLVFSTNNIKQSWDGTFKGNPQDPSVFVWIAEGIDYKDEVVKGKGTITLIR